MATALEAPGARTGAVRETRAATTAPRGRLRRLAPGWWEPLAGTCDGRGFRERFRPRRPGTAGALPPMPRDGWKERVSSSAWRVNANSLRDGSGMRKCKSRHWGLRSRRSGAAQGDGGTGSGDAAPSSIRRRCQRGDGSVASGARRAPVFGRSRGWANRPRGVGAYQALVKVAMIEGGRRNWVNWGC